MGERGYNRNRQDAREGGEIPPLPRNCERPWFDKRRARKPARAFCPFGEGSQKPLEPGSGKVAECHSSDKDLVIGATARCKSGDRSCALNQLAFRGERRSQYATSNGSSLIFRSFSFPQCKGSNVVLRAFGGCSCRVHSRRRHRRVRCQDYRGDGPTYLQRTGRGVCGFWRGRKFPDHDRSARAFLSGGFGHQVSLA